MDPLGETLIARISAVMLETKKRKNGIKFNKRKKILRPDANLLALCVYPVLSDQ